MLGVIAASLTSYDNVVQYALSNLLVYECFVSLWYLLYRIKVYTTAIEHIDPNMTPEELQKLKIYKKIEDRNNNIPRLWP